MFALHTALYFIKDKFTNPIESPYHHILYIILYFITTMKGKMQVRVPKAVG